MSQRQARHIRGAADTMAGNGMIVQGVEVVAAMAAYFLPSIVADRRKRDDVLTIALFNACLGWTVFGWLVALYWAFQPNPPPDVAEDIAKKRRLVSMGTFSKGLVDRVRSRSARAAARDRGPK
ncbi:superinfection immunity protein [Paraburkholderia phosphatilytica]|uniref:superinfection immunity protein n=1 Tax=Paraburkholderia phosphatilytica TaxID=2282883 RepID=UPI003B82D816